MGLRDEECYVGNETRKKLLAHETELSKFGIKLDQYERLRKNLGDVTGRVGLAVSVIEAIRPGTLRELVMFLRRLAVPDDDILRLRLDEPEQILTYCRMDKRQDHL